MNGPYLVKKDFSDVTKLRILKWGDSWILWVGPKCNLMCPHKGKTERGRCDTEEENPVATETEIRVVGPQAKECQDHQKLKEVKKGFSSELPRRNTALPMP